MEKDNNLEVSSILGYYTNGFNIDLIFHVVSILNEGKNFESNFEYNFKVGNDNVCVSFDHILKCLILDIKNNENNLVIKKYSNYIEFIRFTSDGVFKAHLSFENSKIKITTEEIENGIKFKLKY